MGRTLFKTFHKWVSCTILLVVALFSMGYVASSVLRMALQKLESSFKTAILLCPSYD